VLAFAQINADCPATQMSRYRACHAGRSDSVVGRSQTFYDYIARRSCRNRDDYPASVPAAGDAVRIRQGRPTATWSGRCNRADEENCTAIIEGSRA